MLAGRYRRARLRKAFESPLRTRNLITSMFGMGFRPKSDPGGQHRERFRFWLQSTVYAKFPGSCRRARSDSAPEGHFRKAPSFLEISQSTIERSFTALPERVAGVPRVRESRPGANCWHPSGMRSIANRFLLDPLTQRVEDTFSRLSIGGPLRRNTNHEIASFVDLHGVDRGRCNGVGRRAFSVSR